MAQFITFTSSTQQPISHMPVPIISSGFAPSTSTFGPPASGFGSAADSAPATQQASGSAIGWAGQSTLGKRARGSQSIAGTAGMEVEPALPGGGGLGVPPSGWTMNTLPGPAAGADAAATSTLLGRRDREGEDARSGKRPRLLHLGRSFAPAPPSPAYPAASLPAPAQARSQPTTPGWYRTADSRGEEGGAMQEEHAAQGQGVYVGQRAQAQGMDALHRAAAGLVEDVGGAGQFVGPPHGFDPAGRSNARPQAHDHNHGPTPSRIPSPTEAVHHTTPASSFGGVSHMHTLGAACGVGHGLSHAGGGNGKGQGQGHMPALADALQQAQAQAQAQAARGDENAHADGPGEMAVSPGAEGYWMEGMGRGPVAEGDIAMNGCSLPVPAPGRPLSPHPDFRPHHTWLNSVPDTAPPSPQHVDAPHSSVGAGAGYKKHAHMQIQHQEHVFGMGGHDARLHDHHDPMQHDEMDDAMDDAMDADFEMEGVRSLEMGDVALTPGGGAYHARPGGGFAAGFGAFAKHLPKTRYTMGPRPDCEKCRAGVAGHFGHWH